MDVGGKSNVVLKGDTFRDIPWILWRRHNSLTWTVGPQSASATPTLNLPLHLVPGPSQDVDSVYILSVLPVSCACPWAGPLHLLFPHPAVMLLPNYLIPLYHSKLSHHFPRRASWLPNSSPLFESSPILCPSLHRTYPLILTCIYVAFQLISNIHQCPTRDMNSRRTGTVSFSGLTIVLFISNNAWHLDYTHMYTLEWMNE